MTNPSKMDYALSEILEILPPEKTQDNNVAVATTRTMTSSEIRDMIAAEDAINPDIAKDYETSRNTFNDIINKGTVALDDIIELARKTENPKTYEVMATVMKTLADTSKDLFDMHRKVRELKSHPEKPSQKGGNIDEGSITVDKAVFIGTTAELLKMNKKS